MIKYLTQKILNAMKLFKTLNYINDNLNKDLSIDTIASKFFMSKYYLMRKFKAQTGSSLHSYIVQKDWFMLKP